MDDGLGNHCSSPKHAIAAIRSDHASAYDHSVRVVTLDAISLKVHKLGRDVLSLARDLAATAERGDVAEMVRIAGVDTACGEPGILQIATQARAPMLGSPTKHRWLDEPENPVCIPPKPNRNGPGQAPAQPARLATSL
jgi:hypothetical protein